MGKWIVGILLLFTYTIGIKTVITRNLYKRADEQYLKEYKRTVRLQAYYNTLVLWISAKISGINIADYFKSTDKIAVYGMGKIGKLLCKDLLAYGRNVVCGIDKNVSGFDCDTKVKVYSCNEELPNVDCVVISMGYLADDIVPLLEDRENYKIVTIEEILNDICGGIK